MNTCPQCSVELVNCVLEFKMNKIESLRNMMECLMCDANEPRLTRSKDDAVCYKDCLRQINQGYCLCVSFKAVRLLQNKVILMYCLVGVIPQDLSLQRWSKISFIRETEKFTVTVKLTRLEMFVQRSKYQEY